jgi:putative surface-exposed virulence protein
MIMRLRTLAALSAILPALLRAPTPARAGTIHVPADVATVQAALTAAQANDQVEIKGGLYREAVAAAVATNVVIRAKGNVRIDATGLAATAFGVTGTNLQVLGLKVVGGDGDGFDVGGTNVQVTGCKASGVSGRGFVSHGTNVQLTKCGVKGCGMDGLVVESGTNVTFTDCKVLHAGAAGIAVTGGLDVSVVRGRIVRASGSGASIAASNVTIDASKFTAPGGAGIREESGAALSGNSYTHNGIGKPGGSGLELRSVGVTVTANKVGKPGGTGFDVASDYAQVQGNTVTGAGGNGVIVNGDNGTYTGNKSLHSGGSGFRLEGAGNVLSQNVGKGSRGFDLLDASGGANTVQSDNVFKKRGP